MAKKHMLALKYGHQTPFRRTIEVGGEKRVVVFEPDTPYEFTAAEARELQPLVDKGLLIDPREDRRYSGVTLGDAYKTADEKLAEIDELRETLRQRDQEIADLKQQIADFDALLAEAGGDDEEEDDEEEGEDDQEESDDDAE